MRALADLGLTQVADFHDPTAKVLLPPLWSMLFARLIKALGKAGPRARERMQAAADILALRTLSIDAQLRDAVANGVRQVVILGAGLDGRAHRLAELAAVRVFEVDHPATQAFKRRRAAYLSRTAGELIYVPLDFERDALAAALRRSVHDANAPTAWIWEGVVMYLSLRALRQTLAAVAERSATGSLLLINYTVPHTRPLPERLMLRLWREPQIGIRTPEQMATELSAAGFEVVADSAASVWARQFGVTPVPAEFTHGLHLVVARRR